MAPHFSSVRLVVERHRARAEGWYNGLDGKGIDNLIGQLITNLTKYWRYRLKRGRYFLTMVLAEQQEKLFMKNSQWLRAAFREVQQAHPFLARLAMYVSDWPSV